MQFYNLKVMFEIKKNYLDKFHVANTILGNINIKQKKVPNILFCDIGGGLIVRSNRSNLQSSLREGQRQNMLLPKKKKFVFLRIYIFSRLRVKSNL